MGKVSKLVPISGNQYALQTINGNYLTVVNGGGKLTDVIHSDATAIGPWEKFKLVTLTGYLNGYSIPTGVFGLDHTYVTSDNPSFSWECWEGNLVGK